MNRFLEAAINIYYLVCCGLCVGIGFGIGAYFTPKFLSIF